MDATETTPACPFCGGTKLSESAVSNTNGQLRYIVCRGCYANGPWAQNPASASEAWGHRHARASSDMLAALKVAAETLRSFDEGDPSTETGWKHDELCDAWVLATAAISKAESQP